MSADANLKSALRRFAISTTVLNLVGYAYLGFEPAYSMPIVAVLAALATQVVLEWCRAYSQDDVPLFARGDLQSRLDFLLPAYIVGLTCSMFVYTAELYWPLVFAVVLAIASKHLLRVPTRAGSIHFINPATLGITATVLLFPHIGLGLPAMLDQYGDPETSHSPRSSSGSARSHESEVLPTDRGGCRLRRRRRGPGPDPGRLLRRPVPPHAGPGDGPHGPPVRLLHGARADHHATNDAKPADVWVGLAYGLFVLLHLTHARFRADRRLCRPRCPDLARQRHRPATRAIRRRRRICDPRAGRGVIKRDRCRLPWRVS